MSPTGLVLPAGNNRKNIFPLHKKYILDLTVYNGYSTISLGYAGLYEMCVRMTGKSHTDPEAKPFAIKVMQRLNDKCKEWKEAENISYSVYGTPMESTTYKFSKCLQKRFGVIQGVTDKNYITNSYHVHVTEEIDAFSKLKFESDFQKLSPGGAISYVEVPNLQDNIEAVIEVMKFIYDNIMYEYYMHMYTTYLVFSVTHMNMCLWIPHLEMDNLLEV